MNEQRRFGALIIGDEILSGKRSDQHFSVLARLLGTRGYRLAWVEYLGDERARIAATLRRTLASGDVVFSLGGIGNTPDDHTRQAAAEALGVSLTTLQDQERGTSRRDGSPIRTPRVMLLACAA